MSNKHYHHGYRPSPLKIKPLAKFDAALVDLSDEEKKRRICSLRDAVQQLNMRIFSIALMQSCK